MVFCLYLCDLTYRAGVFVCRFFAVILILIVVIAVMLVCAGHVLKADAHYYIRQN